MRRPSYFAIREVIYGLRLCRSTYLDLKWLDKPAQDYLAEHHPDGTVTIEPMSATRYVVRPAEDDQVELRTPIAAKANYVQVHHTAKGKIRIIPWQGIEDEYPKGLEEVGICWSALDGETVVLRYEDGICDAMKMSFLPDEWDRSNRGLDDRPREIKDAERRARLGEEAWQKILERREKTKQTIAAKKAGRNEGLKALPVLSAGGST